MSEIAVKAVGLCGPSGSGKTTLAKMLCKEYDANLVSLDNYFLLDPPFKKYPAKGMNWELPENVDWAACRKDIGHLKEGRSTRIRKMDWDTETFSEVPIEPKEYVIVEGFLLLHDTELLKLLDLSIYIDLPDAIALQRRLEREESEENKKWFEEVTFPEYAPRRKIFQERADLVLDGALPLEENLRNINAVMSSL